MTIYGYKCRACEQTAISEKRANHLDTPCPCGGRFTRDYSGIGVARPMQPHWNPTTQSEVTSMTNFKSQLRKASEEYEDKFGIESRLVPIDPDDTKALGITSEGLDTTNRERSAKGLPPIRVPT